MQKFFVLVLVVASLGTVTAIALAGEPAEAIIKPVPPMIITLPVAMTVGTDGRVAADSLIAGRCPLTEKFVQDLLDAGKRWIFKPALDDNNKPVRSTVTVYFTYSLGLTFHVVAPWGSSQLMPGGLKSLDVVR